MKGIDVSKHQGKIDWAKVKSDGVEFAIIRAGYGMYLKQEDSCFRENIAGAKSMKIPIGIYWYSYATSTAEALKEAETCLQIIGPYKSHITLPVFFDQEYEAGIKAQPKSIRTAMCVTFMDRIKKAGYRTGLYCSYDWYMNWVDRSKLTPYPVWIAQYGAKCQYTGSNLIIWQYSSTGKISGISGNVDMDAGYDGLFPTSNKDGWYKSNEKWRYSKNNRDVTGWLQDKGTWYYLDPDGFMVSDDWRMLDNRWYYLTSNGAMARSWRKVDGWWYYFNLQSNGNGPNGSMLTGMRTIDGKKYYLNENGSTEIPLGAMIVTDTSGAIVLA